MKNRLLFILALCLGPPLWSQTQSPYSYTTFPSWMATAASQTSPTMTLSGSLQAFNYASGTICAVGSSFTTGVITAVGSQDQGANYIALVIQPQGTSGGTSTTATVTANQCYWVNLAGIDHVKLQTTSGTFTGTSLTLTFRANPQVNTVGGGSSGGGGDTITSPNGTITVGGTSAATTLDVANPSGMVLLFKASASTSTAVTVVTRNQSGKSGAIFQSDFDDYVIKIIKLIPTTNSSNIQMQVSTNGGSSYDAGSNYSWFTIRWSNTTSAEGGSASDTKIGLDDGVDGVLNTVADGGMSSSTELFGPLDTTSWKHFIHSGTSFNASSGLRPFSMGGAYQTTTAVNAFQIFCGTLGTNTCASGTVLVYGIAKQ